MDEVRKLKEIRESLNLSQVAVAKELGVTKQYYNKVEKGLSSLSKEKTVQLCKAYNVSFEWFFGDGKQILLANEEINENFFHDTRNLNDLNSILKAYNLYLNDVFKAVKNKYSDAKFEDITTTANILFNQDCLSEDVSFNNPASVKKQLEGNEDFEIRAIGTYYPISVK